MNEQPKSADSGTLPFSAPLSQEKKVFSSSKRELLVLLASYLVAYLYTFYFYDGPGPFSYTLLFAGAFTLWGLWASRGRRAGWESWLWLGCLWLCLLCYLLGRDRVWSFWTLILLHFYAIYWVMSAQGVLTLGKSSHFLPLDGFCGLILLPFKHFFLRIQAIRWGLSQKKKVDKSAWRKIGIAMLAVGVAALFFWGAVSLLSQADSQFQALLERPLKLLSELWYRRLERWHITLVNFFFRFLISLPVGCYLCGLVVGSARETPEMIAARKEGVSGALSSLKKVPDLVWTALLGCFVALYLLFFGVQFSYLFGAFLGSTPPGDFTLAEYARQGFFELCQIMALNFALLWVVAQSSAAGLRTSLPSRIAATVLLVQSILFAVTALSKLWMYISCFGFTPLRIQSGWLVCVLLFGCVCALVWLWSGKDTARVWILFTGVTLALTHLY